MYNMILYEKMSFCWFSLKGIHYRFTVSVLKYSFSAKTALAGAEIWFMKGVCILM